MPDRTTAGRDGREYHPNSGAGRRDKYTGTLGCSGLADAGTTTRGPDGRVDTLRPRAHEICMRMPTHMPMHVHMHDASHAV